MNIINFIEKYVTIKDTKGNVRNIKLKDYQKAFIKYLIKRRNETI